LDRATLVDLAPIGFSVAQKASALIQVVDRPAQLERRQGTIQASSTQLIGIERLQVAALLLVGWHEAQVEQALEEFAPSTQISVSSTSRLSSYPTRQRQGGLILRVAAIRENPRTQTDDSGRRTGLLEPEYRPPNRIGAQIQPESIPHCGCP